MGALNNMSSLFDSLPFKHQEFVKKFIMDPDIKELLNNNNFKALYIFFKGSSVPSSALTALLLDAGIRPFGESRSIIGSYDFMNLPIKEYKIPKGVKKIAPYAFIYCYDLKEIYLPLTIENIHVDAFHDCKKLDVVHYEGTFKQLLYILNISSGGGKVKFYNKPIKCICSDGVFDFK